jgi:hypothetical protein
MFERIKQLIKELNESLIILKKVFANGSINITFATRMHIVKGNNVPLLYAQNIFDRLGKFPSVKN